MVSLVVDRKAAMVAGSIAGLRGGKRTYNRMCKSSHRCGKWFC